MLPDAPVELSGEQVSAQNVSVLAAIAVLTQAS